MVLKLFRASAIVAAVLAASAWELNGREALAVGPGVTDGALFQNYYVPPDPNWGLGAQLYVSPRPTPPMVGQTYITYQPLMPHEFLYGHHRTYRRPNPDGSVTRVRVGWQSTFFPHIPFLAEGKYHDQPRLPFAIGKGP